jgi:KUP system potassium uptake protein
MILMALPLSASGTAPDRGIFGSVRSSVHDIAVLDSGIARYPSGLRRQPAHAVSFFARNGTAGFLVLGAIFLVATGGEALYADLGHFGEKPIQIDWFSLVGISLILNYFGQGALLITSPETVQNPFYRLAPGWALIPLVILATMATIIASQAIISGAFSLTRQAVQLGYLPRVHIVHTSPEEIGQIYIPVVNGLLMVATVGLVLGFRSSDNLAAAYGVAVSMTMVITTFLAYFAARDRLHWGAGAALLVTGLFLVFDISFLAANLAKIEHGGWFPLVSDRHVRRDDHRERPAAPERAAPRRRLRSVEDFIDERRRRSRSACPAWRSTCPWCPT